VVYDGNSVGIITVLQWRLEQLAVLLLATRWSAPVTRGAITGLAAIVREAPRGASPGGTGYRGRHFHDVVREPARTPPAWGVPRRTPGRVYTCESTTDQKFVALFYGIRIHNVCFQIDTPPSNCLYYNAATYTLTPNNNPHFL
jgi:hypothetical protein